MPRTGRGARGGVPASPPAEFEAELIGGLGPFAARELRGIGPAPTPRSAHGPLSLALRFSYAGPWRRLLELRTVVAAHAVVATDLPRPSALLDDGTFKRVLAAIGHIRSLHPSGAFASFRVGAAGADSATFRRVRGRLARETGLRDVEEGGDLLLRFKHGPGTGMALGWPSAGVSGTDGNPIPKTPKIPRIRPRGRRRAPTEGRYPEGEEAEGGRAAFELTVRISPRPLSARAWRICNLPGALNATVASVMAGLTEPGPGDVYLNLACGSGTLLVERAALGPARRLLGCDDDPAALACAAENVGAAGLEGVELRPWDAGAVSLPDGSVDAMTVDLPFGQLVGSHRSNEQLYPRLLADAGRLARPNARLVAITQQVSLFERCLAEASGVWALERTIRLELPANAGVLKPRIYVLVRQPRGGV